MAVVYLTAVTLALATTGTGTASAAGRGTGPTASSGRSAGCGRPMIPTVDPGHEQALPIISDGIASTYQPTVPQPYRPDVAHPVILLFYGWMSNASSSRHRPASRLPRSAAGT